MDTVSLLAAVLVLMWVAVLPETESVGRVFETESVTVVIDCVVVPVRSCVADSEVDNEKLEVPVLVRDGVTEGDFVAPVGDSVCDSVRVRSVGVSSIVALEVVVAVIESL
jgi:hypothetical protein